MPKLRAILPTYVTEKLLVLCKNAPAIRNAYEIRFALYSAVKSNRQFLLVCLSDCIVDSGLEQHIVEHGGSVKRGDVRDYSVYFGAADESGEELGGWVLGDNQRWGDLLRSFTSEWLRTSLRIGAELWGDELDVLADKISQETVDISNIDDEPFSQALLYLVSLAKEQNGSIYLQ